MPSVPLSSAAPAKVNLYLHVGAPDERRYHPLQSLVVFADVGDEVALVEGDGPPVLKIDGPFGAGLDSGESNLIFKALRRFEAATVVRVAHHIRLTKNLPIASGLGGGSSDAGAVLRLLRQVYAPEMSDHDLGAIAGQTGADGVMCLWAQPAIAEGYGERLRAVQVPEMSAVLINPLVESPTAAVYGAYDERAHFAAIEAGFDGAQTVDELVAFLQTTRNDLEAPAVALNPVIAEVLQSLTAHPEALLARMSGSGATCFALCATPEASQALAVKLKHQWPGAWVQACRFRPLR